MQLAYFFSGFDTVAGFTKEISNNIKKNMTKRNLLLFITSTPTMHEKSEKYSAMNKNWFKQEGIFFKEYVLLDDRVDNIRAKELIHTASCIFLMGGNTLAQISFLKNNGLVSAIKNSEAVIMGISAGAINMAKTSLSLEDINEAEAFIYDGIGIADITIEPHFLATKSDSIFNLIQISQQHLVYAMCDNSAIIVEKEQIIYIGKIYEFAKGSWKQISS